MILLTSRQICPDFKKVHRNFIARTLPVMLFAGLLFPGLLLAAPNNRVIETEKITMTGNRQTETAKPEKRTTALNEIIIVTNPIVLSGTRKKSP